MKCIGSIVVIIFVSVQMVSVNAWEWTEVTDFPEVESINFLFESSENYIYTSLSPSGIMMRTHDGGTTWEVLPDLPDGKYVNCLMEASGGVLWAGAGPDGFVFKSDDGGLTWLGTVEIPDVTSVTSLLEVSDGYVYAGTSANTQFGYIAMVFKTNDGGMTWLATTQYPAGYPASYCALVEASDGYIYAAANPDALIMRTNDGGDNWEPGGYLPESYHGVVNSLFEAPDGNLYATATTLGYSDLIGRVYRKKPDMGWNLLPQIPDAQSAGPIMFAPDGFLYVGTSLNGDVFRGYEYGNLWTYTTDTPGSTTVQCLLAGSDGYIYAGCYPEGEIYRGRTPECVDFGVILELSSGHFIPGDIFSCDVYTCVPDQTGYSDVPLFVILDVYGQFFFAPDFSGFGYIPAEPTFGRTAYNIVPAFQWPSGAGSGQATWYAAMTDPEITMLLGNLDMVFFTWGE